MTDMTEPRDSRSTGYIAAGTRIVIAGVGGVLATGLVAFSARGRSQPVADRSASRMGCDGGFVPRLVWAIRGSDSEETARVAKTEDPSRALADLALVSASVASLLGVGLVLIKASSAVGTTGALITAVAVLTVALSWLLVHSVFTLRYADLYYGADGGIDFHDDGPPDFGDFAYIAFTIGMTFQVSDTDLVSRQIRRTASRHALLSYLFGIAVIATTINAVASLLNH